MQRRSGQVGLAHHRYRFSNRFVGLWVGGDMALEVVVYTPHLEVTLVASIPTARESAAGQW
jgi:hypothetical protein